MTGAVALAALGARGLAAARVADVPLARYRVPLGSRVGAEFHERSGFAGDRVLGEMDDLDAFARGDFDTARVAPSVRRFYERTSEYRMTVAAEWHRPFRTGAGLAAPVTSAIEQLNLPGPCERGRVRVVENDLYRVAARDGSTGRDRRSTGRDRLVDPREDARFWVRTDVDTGEAVFVAVYGAHVDADERYVNIAVPLPGGTLSTVLRPSALALADRDGDDVGVDLTTRAPGHPGLFWSTPVADYRLPIQQRFRVWPAAASPGDHAPAVDVDEVLDATGADREAGSRDAALADAVVATHEMSLCGRRFLTVRYVAAPSSLWR